MKLDITIKDVSPEDAQAIVAKIMGDGTTKRFVTVTGPVPPQTENEVAAQNQVAANSTLSLQENEPNVAGEHDSEGLPWDARIHSSNKKKNGDGTWTRRRNVNPSEYDRVYNELRAVYPGPGQINITTPPNAQISANGGSGGAFPGHAGYPAPVSQPVPTPPMPAAPYVDPNAAVNTLPPIPQNLPPAVAPQAYVQPSAPAAYQAPQPPAQPQAPAASAPNGQYTINDLFNKVQQIFSSGDPQQNAAYVTSLTNRLSQTFQVQVNAINDIAGRPDMIAYAFQMLAADGK